MRSDARMHLQRGPCAAVQPCKHAGAQARRCKLRRRRSITSRHEGHAQALTNTDRARLGKSWRIGSHADVAGRAGPEIDRQEMLDGMRPFRAHRRPGSLYGFGNSLRAFAIGFSRNQRVSTDPAQWLSAPAFLRFSNEV